MILRAVYNSVIGLDVCKIVIGLAVCKSDLRNLFVRVFLRAVCKSAFESCL